MIEIIVDGHPAPGGSKRAFNHPHTGKLIVTDACKRNKKWREFVSAEASAQYLDKPLDGPVRMSLFFRMPRFKTHHCSGNPASPLKSGAPEHHTQRPDTTKLVRAVEDALTGVVWVDDAQVITQFAQKVWAEPGEKPGVTIHVWSAFDCD